MLRSFLTITLRILWRNKVTSFINIFSLAIGMTTFILIMLYVHHELSYDKFNENYDRIYRLEADDYGKLPPVIGEYLNNKIPEIAEVACLRGFIKHPPLDLITYRPNDNTDSYKQLGVSNTAADNNTFLVFTLPFIRGDAGSALTNPFTIVLTESISKKLFENKDPMGEVVEFQNEKYMVTGIIKNVKNSHIDFDVLRSLESDKINPGMNPNTTVHTHLWRATYLLLDEEVDSRLVEKKVNKILMDINDGTLINTKFKNFHLRPLRDIYFEGYTPQLHYGKHGNLKVVRTFVIIAIFILALACINYTNLTTARATLRNKEVALKKVVGSTSRLLRYQFILESILVTFISFLLSLTLLQGFLPHFNQLAMVNIDMSELNTSVVYIVSILSLLLIGIISGIYPALYLTSLKSVSLFKGDNEKVSSGAISRRFLLTFQFSVSILLLVGIITNLRQLHYAKTKDLGFDKEHIVSIPTPQLPNKFSKRETIKEKLLQYPDIRKVAFNTDVVGMNLNTFNSVIEGEERSYSFMWIDPDYLDLMGIEIVEGRGYSWNLTGDMLGSGNVSSVILNETAAKLFYQESPVGKIYIAQDNDLEKYHYEVIGIARDFHFRSLHHKIEPIFFVWSESPEPIMNVKISSSDIQGSLKNIEKEWNNIFPATPFGYSFVDEMYDDLYKSDEHIAKIIGYFTILAIIIACMGLYALSTFMVARRTKEIGIRKAMGASSQSIFILLSQEFVKWVLISVIIACPIAWVLMNKWLQGFAYHVKLGADIFMLSALIALIIAMLTVTWQSLKTASANPVEALRYE